MDPKETPPADNAAPTIEALQAQVEDLKRQLEDAKSGLGDIPKELRDAVREKRRAGLDLPTALIAARAQVDWDESQSQSTKKKSV